MSDNLSIYFLNKSNTVFKEIIFKKPKTYKDLLEKIQKRVNIKIEFRLFYLFENKKKFITNEEDYKQTKDIIFFQPLFNSNKLVYQKKNIYNPDINININQSLEDENNNNEQNKLNESNFDIYYNQLPDEEQEKIDDKYCCCVCSIIIKKENPYFCYHCQKLIHCECLENWNRQQKEKGNELDCPYCKNKLPLNEWKKKLDYKETMKGEVENINQINEFKSELDLKKKNINKLSSYNLSLNIQNLEYYDYIEDILNLIKCALIKISEISLYLKSNNNDDLIHIINKLSLNFDIKNVPKIIELKHILYKELEGIREYIKFNKEKNYNKIKSNLLACKNVRFKINNKNYNNKLKNLLIIKNNINFKIDKEIDNHKFQSKLNICNNINFKIDKSINNNSNQNEININRQDSEKKEGISTINNNENEKNSIGIDITNKDTNGSMRIIYKKNESNAYIKIFGFNFVKNNKEKCKIIYLNKFYDLMEELEILNSDTKEEEIEIFLIGINNIMDFSYMFANCSSLLLISDLANCKFENITGIHYMFFGCSSLKSVPDISNFNLNNVSDLSYIFSGCSSIKSLPDISNWNTISVTNISNIFSGCRSLELLPSISRWNTRNVSDMSKAFYDCSLLSTLPDISIWNVENVINMSSMFENCSSLSELPELSNWKINNFVDTDRMFDNCKESLHIPKLVTDKKRRKKSRKIKY